MPKPASLFHGKAEEKPVVKKAEEPKKTKTKTGKHLISGPFDEAAYRQFTILAAELGKERQELLREAVNDVFIKYGKAPIG